MNHIYANEVARLRRRMRVFQEDLWNWIDENAYYCPHCPEGERVEMVKASDLEEFINALNRVHE